MHLVQMADVAHDHVVRRAWLDLGLLQRLSTVHARMPIVAAGETRWQVALAKRRVACSECGSCEIVHVMVTDHGNLWQRSAAAACSQGLALVLKLRMGVLARGLASLLLNEARLQEVAAVWLPAGVAHDVATRQGATVLRGVVQVHLGLLLVENVNIVIVVLQQVVDLCERRVVREIGVRVRWIVFLVLGELVDRLAEDDVVVPVGIVRLFMSVLRELSLTGRDLVGLRNFLMLGTHQILIELICKIQIISR